MNLVLAHVLFAGCAALATWAQNLTGFAFALILLGLAGVFDLAPVADAADAAMLLTLLNAAIRLRQEPPAPRAAPWRVVRPTLAASLVGVGLGVALLSWLGGHAVQALRALLGLAILGCAAMLLLRATPRPALSGPRGFALAGAVSGVMGGLFASPGPPLVFHLYRQPLERAVVQQCLLIVFAANAALRCVLVLAAGRLSMRTLALVACAAPAVWLVTAWQHRHASRAGPETMRRVVAALLALAGLALVGAAVRS